MKLLRLPQVLERVGLGRSRLYSLVKVGEFPRPVRLTQNVVAWVDTEVDEWINGKIQASRGYDGLETGGPPLQG